MGNPIYNSICLFQGGVLCPRPRPPGRPPERRKRDHSKYAKTLVTGKGGGAYFGTNFRTPQGGRGLPPLRHTAFRGALSRSFCRGLLRFISLSLTLLFLSSFVTLLFFSHSLGRRAAAVGHVPRAPQSSLRTANRSCPFKAEGDRMSGH